MHNIRVYTCIYTHYVHTITYIYTYLQYDICVVYFTSLPAPCPILLYPPPYCAMNCSTTARIANNPTYGEKGHNYEGCMIRCIKCRYIKCT